ncbi:uncharacterized protein PpBr36_06159, partial [Pyricularia pennisetigena]|uniref:uncharacterized protein n=1 Tax=Pyricularia pennisetigena TaxID=1578925 RepID=UPI00114FFDEB
ERSLPRSTLTGVLLRRPVNKWTLCLENRGTWRHMADANFLRALCSCAPLAFSGHGLFQSKWKTNTRGLGT